MKIAVVGPNGFVGSAICHELRLDKNIELFEITRANWASATVKFDFLINAACPSKRFKAQQDPAWDFLHTVTTTFDIHNFFEFNKFIHISTISARIATNTVYGRNKLAAESLIDQDKHSIVRLGPMYGTGLTKGVLVDMLNDKKVYAAKNSDYAFVDVSHIAREIHNRLYMPHTDVGVVEFIGKKNYRLGHVAALISSKSTFDGPPDEQIADWDNKVNTHLIRNDEPGNTVIDWALKNKYNTTYGDGKSAILKDK